MWHSWRVDGEPVEHVLVVPVDGGGELRVRLDPDDVPDELRPAARSAGEILYRAKESVQAELDRLRPAVDAVLAKFREMAADEVTVEFGVEFGIEGGVVVAKGSAKATFFVAMSWHRSGQEIAAQPADSTHGG
jgi:hypothetical protein